MSQTNLLRFKLACIQPKSCFFKTETLKIGVIRELERSSNNNYYLKSRLFFENISNFPLQFLHIKIHAKEDALTLWGNNEVFIPHLAEKQQMGHDLTINMQAATF